MWNHGSKGSCVCENLPAQTLESGVGSLKQYCSTEPLLVKVINLQCRQSDWVKTPIIIELCSFVNKSRLSVYIHDSSIKGQINIKIKDDGL